MVRKLNLEIGSILEVAVLVIYQIRHKYKLRNDVVNTNTDIERLWLEVTLRNKNSNLLLGVFYQPNFDNLAKSIWLDRCDDIF